MSCHYCDDEADYVEPRTYARPWDPQLFLPGMELPERPPNTASNWNAINAALEAHYLEPVKQYLEQSSILRDLLGK